MPAEYRGEAIIDAIGAEKIRGARILIPRAQVAREALPKMLREKGAAEVVVAPAYKTVTPSGAALDRMRQALSASGYDLVAFTSSSTAANLVEIVGKPRLRNESRGDRSDHRRDRQRTRLRGRGDAARIHHSGAGRGDSRLLRVIAGRGLRCRGNHRGTETQ